MSPFQGAIRHHIISWAPEKNRRIVDGYDFQFSWYSDIIIIVFRMILENSLVILIIIILIFIVITCFYLSGPFAPAKRACKGNDSVPSSDGEFLYITLSVVEKEIKKIVIQRNPMS